jgi:C_GCAxxG_C_C family probable redox protein
LQGLQEAGRTDDESMVTMASGLHGGIAGLQEVCGAFTGAVVALGYQVSQQGRYYKDHKRTTDQAVRRLAKRFRENFGELRCKDIVGFDFSDPEQFKAFRESDVRVTKCRAMVDFAVKQVLATEEEGGVLPVP